MIYAFIAVHPEHAVARWASFLEVSGSGYYAWLRGREDRHDRDQTYADRMVKVFGQSGGTYRADR